MNGFDIFLLAGVGLIAGFIDTIAGGGGLMTLPAYFMAGLPPHIALGTNKMSSTLSVANATRIFLKKKIFYPRYWIPAMAATFSGGLIGSVAIHFLSNTLIRKFLPIVILGLAIYMAVPKKYGQLSQAHCRPPQLSSSVMGSALGFYDGFFGPGSGSFWVVGLMAIYKIPLVEATGIAKLLNFLSNIAGLLVFILFGSVDYHLGLIVAAAMMTGAFFGAHSAIRWGAPLVRPVFLVIVVGIATTLAWQTWF